MVLPGNRGQLIAVSVLVKNGAERGAFQKSDASGQKRGGYETFLERFPMCVAQLTESGHFCPLPPKCCFTASNILQEWQSDTVFSERPGNADILVGS